MQAPLRVIAFILALALPIAVSAAPQIFYTDIVSGPNTGSPEVGPGNGNGTYLSIFGNGFGTDPTQVTVTVGGGAVARIVYLGASNGRSDIQQLSVQLGPTSVTGAIKVTVGGVDSNTDQTFTVTPGKITLCTTITCVSNLLDQGTAQPGDTVLIRGGTYTSEIYFHNITGTAGHPLMALGYPGESVNFSITGAGTACVHTFYNASNGTQGHLVVAGINCNMNGGGGGVIGMGVDMTDIRVVNNVACCMYEDSGGSAAIDGSGTNFKILGNHVHDNGGSKLYHGLYFDGRAATSDNYEIAYNHIHHQTGGRGIQIFSSASPTTNVRVHHNLIHNIHLDAILFGDTSGAGFQAFNNVVYQAADPAMKGPSADAGTGGACIRFNSSTLVAQVYNNTFVDCAADADAANSEGIFFQAGNTITLRNNIIALNAGTGVSTGTAPYFAGSTTPVVSSNNLWFGNGGAPAFDTSPQTANPLFVSAAVANFHVTALSPAIDHGSTAVNALVPNDFDGNVRPQGSAPDIGAFESNGVTLPTPQNLTIGPPH